MSETIVLSAVHGIAPRSDELLKLGADYERGRATQETFTAYLVQEADEWLQVQREAGIAFPENGKLGWQDHLRPLVNVTDGFAPDVDNGTVTRWFEDNRFYRQPIIVDRLQLDLTKFEQDFPPTGENISLLSPRSFSSLCANAFAELPAERNIVQLYGELLFCLEQRGVKRVTFTEYLPAALHGEGLDSIKLLADWSPDIAFAVFAPGGQCDVPYNPTSNIGIGLEGAVLNKIATSPEYRRPAFKGKEIWHQAIDTTNTQNTKSDIEAHLDIIRELAPARLVITHTVDLECLPLVVVKDKVKQLGELAAKVAEKL